MNRFERYALGVILGIIALGVFLANFNHDYFQSEYVREDGFVEWMTVLCLVLGAVKSAERAFLGFSHRSLTYVAGCVLLAAAFIFGAGEEISWGQRILDIKSSDFFLTHNSQGETNLHNLVYEGIKINKVVFGSTLGVVVVFYMLILPMFYIRFTFWKKLVEAWAIPLPKFMHIICYIVLALLAFITPSGKKGELLEFGGCAIFFLLVLFPSNSGVFKDS